MINLDEVTVIYDPTWLDEEPNVVWRWKNLFEFLVNHRVSNPLGQSARLLRAQLRIDLRHL